LHDVVPLAKRAISELMTKPGTGTAAMKGYAETGITAREILQIMKAR
jgi:hypothetical protein